MYADEMKKKSFRSRHYSARFKKIRLENQSHQATSCQLANDSNVICHLCRTDLTFLEDFGKEWNP